MCWWYNWYPKGFDLFSQWAKIPKVECIRQAVDFTYLESYSRTKGTAGERAWLQAWKDQAQPGLCRPPSSKVSQRSWHSSHSLGRKAAVGPAVHPAGEGGVLAPGPPKHPWCLCLRCMTVTPVTGERNAGGLGCTIRKVKSKSKEFSSQGKILFYFFHFVFIWGGGGCLVAKLCLTLLWPHEL